MDFNRIVRNTPWCLLGIWLKIKFSTSKWLNYSLTLSRRINRLMWVSQNSVSQLITQSCPTLSTPRTAAHQASLSITNSGGCSNSSPSNWWCPPTVSSSVVPFSFFLQSFPASGSFLMSQFFTSGGQSIGVSSSASVLPMNIQDRFPLGFTRLIS